MVKPGLKDPVGWNWGIKRLVGLGLMPMHISNFKLIEHSAEFSLSIISMDLSWVS